MVSMHTQCYWSCVAVCQQHVGVGLVCLVFLISIMWLMGLCGMRNTGQYVDTGWVKVVSRVHLLGRVKVVPSALVFFNLCDVEDGFLLRCSGRGIASVTCIVSNTLTSKDQSCVQCAMNWMIRRFFQCAFAIYNSMM